MYIVVDMILGPSVFTFLSVSPSVCPRTVTQTGQSVKKKYGSKILKEKSLSFIFIFLLVVKI